MARETDTAMRWMLLDGIYCPKPCHAQGVVLQFDANL